MEVDSVAEFELIALNQSENAIKAAIVGLCGDIISDTPVDTGRLKNNWFPSVDAASTETTEQTADAARTRLETAVSQGYKLDRVFYFTNNLPYAYRIEFEGWSKKAPQGMVRRNIVRWNTYFRRANAKG